MTGAGAVAPTRREIPTGAVAAGVPASPLVLDGVVPYPADVAAAYRSRGLWSGETLGGMLRTAARRSPDAVAVVDAERSLTYAELDDSVDRVARALARIGLRRGDRVVVQLPNVVGLAEVLLGAARAGVVPVLALPAHRSAETGYFAEHTDAVAYVTVDEHAAFDHAGLAVEVASRVPSVRHVVLVGALTATAPAGPAASSAVGTSPGLPAGGPAPTTGFTVHWLADLCAGVPAGPVEDAAHPGDVALLQLSGGSTGTPKLIPRTHDDYLYSVRESARICGLDASSVYLAALPVAHNYGLSSPGLLGALYAGGTVLLSTSGAPDVALPLLAQHHVTHVALVPPLARVWLDSPLVHDLDLSALRVVQVGGAKLGTSTARRVLATFRCTLQQVFGMAEGLVCYTRLDDPEDVVTTTQGRPISADDEVRVVDDAGRPVATGEPGHLLTRGPYTIRGYYRAPEHDALAFTPDGFYRTGDLVTQDAAGYLVVTGRAKEQINRGGEKIAPAEVENHLLAHPDVRDVSVVGEPDEYLGERVVAFVVPRACARPTPVALRRFLRMRGIAAYKIPDRLELVETLPTTAVGKVDRRELRSVR